MPSVLSAQRSSSAGAGTALKASENCIARAPLRRIVGPGESLIGLQVQATPKGRPFHIALALPGRELLDVLNFGTDDFRFIWIPTREKTGG